MTIPDDLTSTRTHAHRLVEAEFLVGNKDSILSALEGRDREIEALRARVGWEVAERNREAGARNVATAVDLGAIEARRNAATPGPWEVDDRVRCMAVVSPSRVDLPGLGHDYSGVVAFWSGPSSSGDPAGSWSDERRARIESDADLIAHAPEDLRTLVAEVRRLTDALATARLDGARAMREAAASILDDCAAEHYRTDEDDLYDLIRAIGRDVRRLDPAAVVGSGS